MASLNAMVRRSIRSYSRAQSLIRFIPTGPEWLSIMVNSVRIITSDVALVNVTTTTGGQDRQGEKLLKRKARGTWVLHRQKGSWLIIAMRGMPTEEDRIIRESY